MDSTRKANTIPAGAGAHSSADESLALNSSGVVRSGFEDANVVAANQVTTDPACWLPSFFIVGPPRTGTSWLHEVLREHTNLPSPLKETRFFDENFQCGLNWYQSQYKSISAKQPVGEVAPTYFASSAALRRIALMAPRAKIVCIFRNPVERVLSLYRLKRAYGMIPWNLEEAIAQDPELTESSKYGSNLRAWQLAFGKDNVFATVYDDLRDHPQSYLDQLADFIGIPRFALKDGHRRNVHNSESLTHPRSYYRTRRATVMAEWFKVRRLGRLVVAFNRSPLRKLVLGGGEPFSAISRETAARLHDRFRAEVEQLESMLNRDFSSWKSFKAV